MDVDVYRVLIKKYWLLLLAIILVIVGGTWIFTTTRAPAYEGSILLSVAQKIPADLAHPSSEQFGEFYSIQGSNYLADYFDAVLRDPATVNEIVSRGESSLPKRTITRLGRTFDIRPVGTVGLQVFHETANQSETERVLSTLGQVAKEKLGLLQAQGFYQDFEIIPGPVFVKEKVQSLPVNLGISALAGGFLAFLALVFLAVLEPKKS